MRVATHVADIVLTGISERSREAQRSTPAIGVAGVVKPAIRLLEIVHRGDLIGRSHGESVYTLCIELSKVQIP